MNKQERKKLIEAAIFAPSADNSQPFLYSWGDNNELFFSLDPNLSGQATDSSFVLSDLAVGAAIESIVITALLINYVTDVKLFPKGESELYDIAKLTFTGSEAIAEEDIRLAQQIPSRCTDRRFPFKGEVTDSIIEQIKSAVNSDKHQVLGFNRRTDINSIVPTIFKAEKVRFESEQLHQEIFKTVVFNRDYASQGMNLDVLGIKKFESMGFSCIKRWKTMEKLNWIGASKEIAKKSVVKPIEKSPALLLLTTPSSSRTDIIGTGRQMLRVWLKCTELGLSVQLYAAPGVLSLVKPEIGPDLLSVLAEVEKELLTITRNSGRGLLFFRIGFCEGQPYRTGRRSVEDLLRKV
ncbi:MAG: hypothetical protein QNK36_05660 [Colwellia sp.]|nr:hypothetical protein [Colwellia sp.]